MNMTQQEVQKRYIYNAETDRFGGGGFGQCSRPTIRYATGAGTLAYASPEQLRQREIRKNTDLWSFGVIAFQTLTGRYIETSILPLQYSEYYRFILSNSSNMSKMESLGNYITERGIPEYINFVHSDYKLRVFGRKNKI